MKMKSIMKNPLKKKKRIQTENLKRIKDSKIKNRY